MNYVSRLFALLFGALIIGSVFSPVQAQDTPFITVWDTENSGTSDNDQIIIPGTGTEYTIIWTELGDSSNTDTTTATDDKTITFPNRGVYRIEISGNFTRIHFGGDSGDDANKIIQVEQWGDIEWATMERAFAGAEELDISADDTPDLSGVANMRAMFSSNSSLVAENSSIPSWDVSSVSNMRSLFLQADSFNQPLDSWDVSGVNNMSRMFESAESYNRSLNGWNVINVSNMKGMFSRASSFNISLNDWDVSSVNNMREMFDNATSFNSDISTWDVSSVKNMKSMFGGASSFNGDITSWDVSNVENMESMFFGAQSFNRDISSWDVSSVRDMRRMFRSAQSFNQNIPSWNVSNVDDMKRMFDGASSFNQDIGLWDISSVNRMTDMFDDSSISRKNYDRTVIGWTQNNLRTDVVLGATVEYCNSGPFRNHLIESLEWSIIDSGLGINCPQKLTSSQHKQINGDGTFEFGEVAITMELDGVIGSGRFTLVRYDDQARNIEGIP